MSASSTRSRAAEELESWELGQPRGSVDRALLLLALGTPGVSMDELSSLTVGQRNRRLLLECRSRLGRSFRACATCPECGSLMEMTLSPESFLRPESLYPTCTAELEGYRFICDLPTSRHLALAAQQADIPSARAVLIESCVQGVTHQGVPTDLSSIPDATIVSLGECLSELDPHADLRLRLVCGDCEHRWPAALDLVQFLWEALQSRVQGIMEDVHRLAAAYGWDEGQILSMTPTRRRAYLGMCP